MSVDNFYEEFKVKGRELVDTVRKLIHEGNVRRIIIKDEKGHTFVEIPVTLAAVGIIVAPVLAAIGAIAAMAAVAANFTIVAERAKEGPPPPPAA